MKNKQAFTLVELIVVITILAILGTIAFLSFQGYSRDARDSVRISDLNNISRGMEFMLTKTGRLPVPEDSVEITASGTIISYQGYAGENVLSSIGVNNGGKDPKDDEFYTYVSNANYTKYQLLGFLENGDQIGLSELNQVNADLSERFPVTEGFELGVITDYITKNPIQKSGSGVDLNSTINIYDVIINHSQKFSGDFNEIHKIITFSKYGNYTSCSNLLSNHSDLYNKNGLYTLKLDGEYREVYCDMTTDGGGWTLFSYKGRNYTGNDSTSGLVTTGSLDATGMGAVNILNNNFSGIMAQHINDNNYIIFDNINVPKFKAELSDTDGEVSMNYDAQTNLGQTNHKGHINGFYFDTILTTTIFEIHHSSWLPYFNTNFIIQDGPRAPGSALSNILSFSNHGGKFKDQNGVDINSGEYGLFFR